MPCQTKLSTRNITRPRLRELRLHPPYPHLPHTIFAPAPRNHLDTPCPSDLDLLARSAKGSSTPYADPIHERQRDSAGESRRPYPEMHLQPPHRPHRASADRGASTVLDQDQEPPSTDTDDSSDPVGAKLVALHHQMLFRQISCTRNPLSADEQTPAYHKLRLAEDRVPPLARVHETHPCMKDLSRPYAPRLENTNGSRSQAPVRAPPFYDRGIEEDRAPAHTRDTPLRQEMTFVQTYHYSLILTGVPTSAQL